MIATQAPVAPTAEFIEAFNAQLREAKTEALNVLVAIMRIDTDKDIAIRTQQRLAATAILRVKELKPPKPPREPRVKRAKPEHPASPMPRSLKSLDTPALIELAHRAFAADSDFRPMDKIRLARHLAFEQARQARVEMRARCDAARALRRKPES